MTAQRNLKALRQVVRHLATGGSVQEESEAAAITTAAAGPGSSSVRVFRCGGDAAASKGFTVAMLGAGGGIGQPLSMLLKMSPLIGELRLYDVVRTLGVGADLGHMDTPAVLKAFVGAPEDKTTLREALRGCDLVTITAGVARKPGMTRDDLFAINASIVKGLIEAVADACPTAMINLISNPVNSLVPMAREVLKAKGVYDPRKLTGVTLLDIIRANTFVAEMKGLDPASTHVPVIGGHSGQTILPLLSQTTPSVTFTATEAASLTDHIRNAGTEVVDAKEGEGSATLATAYAGSRFAEQCLKGLAGESITEWAYVDDHSLGGAEAISGCEFFARKCQFGPTGVEEVLHTGPLNETEQTALDGMLDELKRAISKGIEFAV